MAVVAEEPAKRTHSHRTRCIERHAKHEKHELANTFGKAFLRQLRFGHATGDECVCAALGWLLSLDARSYDANQKHFNSDQI